MAMTLLIEEERGTCSGRVHPHNGYYAGDFSATHQPVSPWSLHAFTPASPAAAHRVSEPYDGVSSTW